LSRRKLIGLLLALGLTCTVCSACGTPPPPSSPKRPPTLTPAPTPAPAPTSPPTAPTALKAPHDVVGEALTIALLPVPPLKIASGGALTLVAAYKLHSTHKRFGGFSGLVLSADGQRLVAISDRCWWLTASVRRDASGKLVGLEQARMGHLRGLNGAPLDVKRCDPEGLTTAADGTHLVSFERDHRVWRYGRQGLAGPAQFVWRPDDAARMPNNGGLEVIAALPDGRTLGLCERHAPKAAGLRRGWVVSADGKQARPIDYPVSESFVPTDAAALRDGSVLVVERAFSLLTGVRARIRRVAARELQPGGKLAPQELLRLGTPQPVDNFEGIAVHRDVKRGATFVYILSDDNFSALQRTLLFQFQLKAAPTGG
jgi:hypothetical protein